MIDIIKNNSFNRRNSHWRIRVTTILLLSAFGTLVLTKRSIGQEMMFKATFEQNSLAADVGKSFAQTDSHGLLEIVPNPSPDDMNSSAYVLRSAIEQSSKARAEYSNATSTRYPTEGETHIYTWKRYYPKGMFEDINLIWLLVAQWKTWPCEKNGEHGEYICPGGAIFNDVDFKSCETEKFRFRALPDCNDIYVDVEEGVWEKYTMIIHWSNSNHGYYHLFKNNKLIGGEIGVKTIYDNFPKDHSCDIYFTLGLYSGWSSQSKDSLSIYIDDFAVYKATEKSDLDGVCSECASQITGTSSFEMEMDEEFFHVISDTNNCSVSIQLKNKSCVSLYNISGDLIFELELPAGENPLDMNLKTGTFLIKVTDSVSNDTSVRKIII